MENHLEIYSNINIILMLLNSSCFNLFQLILILSTISSLSIMLNFGLRIVFHLSNVEFDIIESTDLTQKNIKLFKERIIDVENSQIDELKKLVTEFQEIFKNNINF